MVGLSVVSLGERVTATLTHSAAGVSVEIASQPLLGSTPVDYGKNRRNVERVATRVRELTATR